MLVLLRLDSAGSVASGIPPVLFSAGSVVSGIPPVLLRDPKTRARYPARALSYVLVGVNPTQVMFDHSSALRFSGGQLSAHTGFNIVREKRIAAPRHKLTK